MKFSIITASFHSGEKLLFTVKSILEQEFQGFEIIVKDGGSKDGSIERLRLDGAVRKAEEEGILKLIVKPDKGVYDGMNQALEFCRGEYVLFLNCGDRFHDRTVLAKAAEEIGKRREADAGSGGPIVYYGNTYCMRTDVTVHSAPEITGFTCYRNIPCHQSCFYDSRLFEGKKYDVNLKIRADYDHFLWCFYQGKAEFRYLDFVVADYEGGGISETKENRKLDKTEHTVVIKRYMKQSELLRYRGIMWLTLAPLRRWAAESGSFSKGYHRLKDILYKFKNTDGDGR